MSGTSKLTHVQLGDIICLPDGRAMTARSRVVLANPVGSMAGFVIAGEMEVLVSSPSSDAEPLLIYVPVDHLPDSNGARTAAVGAASYWAPHLPAIRGAMGEITYRVVEIRGTVDPVVIVYRGSEVIVFIRAATAWPGEIDVMFMRRDAANDIDVQRHTGIVTAPGETPAEVDLDELVRTHERARGRS